MIAVFALIARGDAAPESAVDRLLDASLLDLDGHKTTLADLRGKPAVIAFWTRWCTPCRSEIAVLQAARERYAEPDVAIVAVALDDNVGSVRDFAAAYGIRYRVVLSGPDGTRLLGDLGNTGAIVPYTLVLDRSTQPILAKMGSLDERTLSSALAAAGSGPLTQVP